jgi:putative component of membrane protein insertase Oxa1/YidC/SpoIIIJ protein YidD
MKIPKYHRSISNLFGDPCRLYPFCLIPKQTSYQEVEAQFILKKKAGDSTQLFTRTYWA